MSDNQFILGRHLIDELIKQGIADDTTTRVTIDCPVNDIVRVYVEKVGDKRLLSIVPPLAENGVEIHRIDPKQESDDISYIQTGLSEKDVDRH